MNKDKIDWAKRFEFLQSPDKDKEQSESTDIDWGKRFGTTPNRLSQIRTIDNKISELEAYGKQNQGKWNDKTRKSSYSGPMGMFAHPSQYTSSAIPKEQKEWSTALSELRQARKNLDTYTEQDDKEDTAAGDERSGWSTMWDGLTNQTARDVGDLFTFGLMGTSDDIKISNALSKASKGEELSDVEQMMVDSYKMNRDAQQYVADRGGATTGYTIGSSLPQSAQFMIETAATGGSLAIVKAGAKHGIKSLAKGLGTAAYKEALRTPLRGSMYGKMAEKEKFQYGVDENGDVKLEDPVSFAENLWKSYASTFAEGFSEQVGNFIPEKWVGNLAKKALKPITPALAKLPPKVIGARASAAIGDGVEKVGDAMFTVRKGMSDVANFNGTVNEYLEEQVSMLIEPLLTGEPERIKEMFDSKTQLTTLGSVGLFGGAMNVITAPLTISNANYLNKMRQNTNSQIASIKDDNLRQGIYDVLKKSNTIEQMVEGLSTVTDWSKADPQDVQNTIGAYISKVEYDVRRGSFDENRVESLADDKLVQYKKIFDLNKNEDTGLIHEMVDDAGNKYYSQHRENEADDVIIVRDASGKLDQKAKDELKQVREPFSYEEGARDVLVQLSKQVEQQSSRAEREEAVENVAASNVVANDYKMDDEIETEGGRIARFIKYNHDGTKTADVEFTDEETGYVNSETIQQVDIIGKINNSQDSQPVANPETVQPETVVNQPVEDLQQVQNQEEQPVEPVVPTDSQAEILPQIPLQKNGDPDYDSMSASMFLEEFGKQTSPEEARKALDEELKDYTKKIKNLKSSTSTGRNKRVENNRKIKEYEAIISDITSALYPQQVPESEPQQVEQVSETVPQPSYEVGEQVKARYEQAPKDYGTEDTIYVPGSDEKVAGRFVLIESGAVTPSHNSETFARSEGFPVDENGSTVNDRDYGKDTEAQKQVTSISQVYNGRAIQNPVIVTKDGIVISGNNRTMSGELAATKGTDRQYVADLRTSASKYGFTPEQVASYQHPRVVFETAETPAYNTETFAKFNAQDTKTQNKVERAIKAGKTITPRSVRHIADIIDKHDTLGDFYSDRNSIAETIKTLQTDGVINSNEVAELKDGENLSAIGKDMVETLLIGSVMSEDAVRLMNSDGMRKYRNRITKAILPVVENSTLGDYSIADALNESVTILDKARQQGGTVDDATLQLDAFNQVEHSAEAISIAKMLESAPEGALRNLFTEYNKEASAATSGQMDLMSGSVRSKGDIMQALGLVSQQSAPVIDNSKSGDNTIKLTPEVESELNRLNSLSPISMLSSPLNLLNIYGDKLSTEDKAEIEWMNENKGNWGVINRDSNVIYSFGDRVNTPQKVRRVWLHETAHAANAKYMSQEELTNVFDRVGLDYLSNLVPKLYLEEYNNMVAMGDIDFAKATLVDEVIAANEKIFAKDDTSNQLIDGTLDASNLNELGAIMYDNITKYIKENHNGISLHNNNDSQNKKSTDIAGTEQIRDGNIHQAIGETPDDTGRGRGYDSTLFDRDGTYDASNDRATSSEGIDNQQTINLASTTTPIRDTIAESRTPEDRHKAVSEFVTRMNETTKASVSAFSDIKELPEELQKRILSDPSNLDKNGNFSSDIDGLFFNNAIYLSSPKMNDQKRAERTYIHEVVGHQFIDKLIKKNQREMLFNAVVDDIGIEHMLSHNIDELNEEVERYQDGIISKHTLGREYIAYLTEKYFTPEDFDIQNGENFVDLSNPITDEIIGSILKATNNGTGKIGIIPNRTGQSKRLRTLGSLGQNKQEYDGGREDGPSVYSSTTPSDGDSLGAQQVDQRGVGRDSSTPRGYGDHKESLPKQEQRGANRNQQGVVPESNLQSTGLERAEDGSNQGAIAEDSRNRADESALLQSPSRGVEQDRELPQRGLPDMESVGTGSGTSSVGGLRGVFEDSTHGTELLRNDETGSKLDERALQGDVPGLGTSESNDGSEQTGNSRVERTDDKSINAANGIRTIRVRPSSSNQAGVFEYESNNNSQYGHNGADRSTISTNAHSSVDTLGDESPKGRNENHLGESSDGFGQIGAEVRENGFQSTNVINPTTSTETARPEQIGNSEPRGTNESKINTDSDVRNLSAVDNVLEDDDIRLRETSFDGELTQEMEQIKDEAIHRGDYMMAPNGEHSNLNEDQWLQVRTQAFKEWFGDWPKAARIEKLRSSETVEITGKEVIPSEDMKEYRRNALEHGKSFKGEYINQDTGISILVSNTGLEKLLSHDKQNIPHIQSIAAIPQLIENSVFIDELQPGKDNHKFDSYKYFVSGLNINGEDYTIKIVVGEKNGNRYYDHSLTEIEKGELLSKIDALSIAFNANNSPETSEIGNSSPLSEFKDKRLLSILQTNSSKVVDANGEPMVVYHGTGKQFNEFDTNRASATGAGSFFTTDKEIASEYAGKISNRFRSPRLVEAFINLRNPFDYEGNQEHRELLKRYVNQKINKDETHRQKITTERQFLEANFDGEIRRGRKNDSTTFIIFNPNQIKSATDNIGSFGIDNNDIRYKDAQTLKESVSEAERHHKWEQEQQGTYKSQEKRHAEVRKVLQELAEKFNTPVEIVTSKSELPYNLRYRNETFAGAYQKSTGKVYFVLDNISDVREAQRTFLHEVVSHKGIDGLLGGAKNAARFYEAVFDSLDSKAQQSLLAEHKTNNKALAGDEMVARMAEGDVTPGVMQRVVSAVRRFFREVLGVPLRISQNDIRYILWKSKNNLQRANTLSEVFRVLGNEKQLKERLYPKEKSLFEKIQDVSVRHRETKTPQEINSNFNRELGMLRSGSLSLAHNFFLGMPSEALLSSGMPNLPVELSAERLLRKSNQSNHPFDLSNVENLPEAIANPIAVFNSKTQKGSKVLLTELSNGKKNFVVAIKTGVDSDSNIQILEVNSVRSLYPRDSHQITNWIAKDGLLQWVDKKKALDFLSTQWLNYIASGESSKSQKATAELWTNKSGIQSSDFKGGQETDLSSATKVVESFENPISDFRFREVSDDAPAVNYRAAGKQNTIKSAGYRVQQAIQDATIKVHTLQKEIKERGGTIDATTNVYESLNHRDSRISNGIDKYNQHYIKPFIDYGIKTLNKDYTVISDYLLAKHSIERHNSGTNALSDKENGWTKKHTQELVEKFEVNLTPEQLKQFWALWRKSTNRLLDIAVESGRMSLDQRREILDKKWDHYVPLRAKDFDFEKMIDLSEVYNYSAGLVRAGASASKKVLDIKAKGRKSKADDPISMLINMAALETYHSEVNKSNQTLLRLARQYPEMTDLFKIKQRWYVKIGETWEEVDSEPEASVIDVSNTARKEIRKYKAELRKTKDADKIVDLEEKIDEAQSRITVTFIGSEAPGHAPFNGGREREHEVTVMKDGVKYTVRLVDPEIAQAINGATGGVQKWLSKYPGYVTRLMAKLSTSKNPAFIIPNFIRDVAQAMEYNFVDSDGNLVDFTKHVAGSWKILHRAIGNSANPLSSTEQGTLNILNEEDRKTLRNMYGKHRVNDTLYDLFAANGGETGYVHILSPEELQRKIGKDIINSNRKAYHPKKMWRGMNFGIDYTANMSENSVRFATFMSQIDNGKNVFDAVTYAKNITVNFNRKGKYGKGIGALYMFFNAGMQGVQNSYSLWGNKDGKDSGTMAKQRAKFILTKASMAAIGYGLSMWAASVLADLIGDDGEEFQISDYERLTNIIIPLGGKDYAKIPIPISARPFYALGVMTADVVNGKAKVKDVLTTFAGAMLNATSPVQIDVVDIGLDNDTPLTYFKPFIPSLGKPVADLYDNRNFAGRKIYRESLYNPNVPNSELGMYDVNGIAQAISSWLNELGGGNAVTPAGVNQDGTRNNFKFLDWNPSMIEHLVKGYTGGVGRMITDAITSLSQGYEHRRMPIGSRFVGSFYEKDPSREFYDIEQSIKMIDKNNRDTEELGIRSTFFTPEEFNGKKQEYHRLRQQLKSVQKRIRFIQEKMTEAQYNSPEYKECEKQIDKLQREYIKSYNNEQR